MEKKKKKTSTWIRKRFRRIFQQAEKLHYQQRGDLIKKHHTSALSNFTPYSGCIVDFHLKFILASNSQRNVYLDQVCVEIQPYKPKR